MNKLSENNSNISESQFNLPPYRNVSIAGLLLFNFYVIIWWLEIGKRIPFFAAIRFEFLLGAVVGLLALITYVQKRGKKSDNGEVAFAALLFILVLFLSLPLAVNFETAWQAYINWVIKYALMTFFITQFVVSPQTLAYFLFSTFLAFFKIGQEAFYGKITGNMVWYNQGIPRLHGTAGTMFGHPNSLSGKFVTSLAFIYYFLPVLKKNWLKVLIAVQFIFTITIVLYTGSRTGYITLIVLLFFIVILSKKKLMACIVVIVLSLFSVQYIPDYYKERFLSSFVDEKAQGASKEARTNLLKDSFSVFLENPFGVGLACFREVQRNAGRNPQDTHNLYTQLLAEAGIQGFVCFSYLVWVILKKIRKIRYGFIHNIERLNHYKCYINSKLDQSVTSEINSNKMLLAVTNAVLVFILVRLVLGIFGHDLFEIYWWIAAGLAMSLSEISINTSNRVEKIHSIGRMATEDNSEQ